MTTPDTTLLDTLTPDQSAHIVLRIVENGSYLLTWNDGVANEWVERYEDPAVAFARVAVLFRAVAAGRFFRHQSPDYDGSPGPAAFITDADAFLTDQLS